MAAGQPDKKERKEKKDKKRSDDGGIKKDKKDRKEKKEKKAKLAAALDSHLDSAAPATTASPVVKSTSLTGDAPAPAIVAPATLVPFAIPLADEKNMKKVLKTVRKAAKNNALKRGVKEVVKALRKSPASSPTNRAFIGVVVIAGDISPQDVISHLPVLCEDHNVPYIFVPSRAELGAAAKTKRPTSVVMIMEKPEAKKAKAKDAAKEKKDDKDGEDDGEKYPDTYQSLVKLVQKETEKQAFW